MLKIISILRKVDIRIYMGIVILILGSTTLIFLRVMNANARLNRIYLNDVITLKTGLKSSLDNNGKLIVENGILKLEVSDIKVLYDKEVVQVLKDMDIRLRRMESFSSTGIESTHEIKTTLKDSVIIRDGVVENLQYIDYNSLYLDFFQIQYGDLVKLKITKRDSLIQVVYQPIKEGFFLWRWVKSKPALEQKIRSVDPNSIIKYNRYIVPIKNKRR